MNGPERELRKAERLSDVHEEALCSIDHREPGYQDLRAATSRVVLLECILRDIVGEIEEEVAAKMQARLRVVA